MNVACPHCGQKHELGQESIGQVVRCAACGNMFTVANPNLAPCPDCFALISRRAAVCPHCGAPVNGNGSVALTSDTAAEEEVFQGHPATMYFCLQIIFGILLIPAVVGIFLLLDAFINIHCTIYTVTTKRVVVKTGWLNKKQVEIWIKDMRGVNLQEDLWQRIIGTGSVAIGTAATSGTEIQMNGLRNAQELVDKINSLRH
ncbi:MAG: PH domain-containing protein [Victivallales bacterium]|nr:PH domain-containing protein [Victivallales bacterium]